METASLKEYRIPFVGLKNKTYHFDYDVDNLFFKHFENSNIENCNVNIKLSLTKKEQFMLLNFKIDGYVEVPCDRCLELYNQEIFDDFEVLVKFSEDIKKDDEDVLYIPKNSDFIDVSKLIYDFIHLSLPLRCVHPNDRNGKSTCNKEVLKALEKNEEKNEDPRWEALKKLKQNKSNNGTS